MNTQYKKLQSQSIYYYVTGEKNASCLFFLHPAFADHRTFNKQIGYFSRNHNIITVDLLGHG